ncbi:MAG: hypothetical protein HY774_21610 [Acidobacteria bacterium]|nr:hypothetical protein [Acidobacteriota bacterium]
MKLTNTLFHRRKPVLLALVVLLVLIGVGIGLTGRSSQAKSGTSSVAVPTPVPTPVAPLPAKVQSEQVGWIVVYATPFGFEPAEVTVPAGTRVLNVQTCTGTLVAPTYRLTRPNSSPLDLPQEGNDAKAELTLTAGTYQLSDPANADVGSCTITVTP